MTDSYEEILRFARTLRQGLGGSDEEAVAFLNGVFTKAEVPVLNNRVDVKAALERDLASDNAVSFRAVAREFGCSEETVARVWPAIRDQYPPTPPPSDKFVVLLPKEARANALVESVLAESGFRLDPEAKAIVDIKNGLPPIAYKVKRGREILVALKAGIAHAGFLGNDKIIETQADARANGNDPIELDIRKQFFVNAFRMCLAVPKEQTGQPIRDYADLQDKVIATSYVETLKEFLAARNITARKIMYLSGGVEESCREFGVDAIMDIVETGGSLRRNGLVALGDPLYEGNMSFMSLTGTRSTMLDSFAERLQVKEAARAAA
ncbi:MAG: ATP phosphoribosyltransferase [Alphaproteobacteria bacterium]|nr:ATP phosphoribosyltransferase [Alphaproteobacteria bacterium]